MPILGQQKTNTATVRQYPANFARIEPAAQVMDTTSVANYPLQITANEDRQRHTTDNFYKAHSKKVTLQSKDKLQMFRVAKEGHTHFPHNNVQRN